MNMFKQAVAKYEQALRDDPKGPEQIRQRKRDELIEFEEWFTSDDASWKEYVAEIIANPHSTVFNVVFQCPIHLNETEFHPYRERIRAHFDSLGIPRGQLSIGSGGTMSVTFSRY